MKNNIIRNIEKIFTNLGFEVGYRLQRWDTIGNKYLETDQVLLENEKGSFWVKVALDGSVIQLEPNSPKVRAVTLYTTKNADDPA